MSFSTLKQEFLNYIYYTIFIDKAALRVQEFLLHLFLFHQRNWLHVHI